MRKICLVCCLALSVFSVGGCGAKDAEADVSTEENIPAATETESVPDTEISQATSEVVTGSGISFYGLTETSSFYAEEDPDVEVLDASASYPVITVPENQAATDKINAAISAELQTFWTFEEKNSSYISEEYEMLKDEQGSDFEPYSASMSYVMKRCDERVISLVLTQDDYTGGAHGNHWSYGLNFDASTGDRLYLEALGDDSGAFRQMLLDNLNGQAADPAYENFVFSDFASDVETSLLGDSTVWYFDSSGMTFISNPYVLGSYAAGTFEFNIPYAELEGLKEQYGYTGSYIRKLFPGIAGECDLDGDGAADQICYSLQTDEDFSDFTATLSIDGKDFSDQIESLHLTDPWTGAYYLMDVDPEDDYVEIAISNQNYESESGNLTHFYRYHGNGELVYQGSVPGIYEDGQEVRYNSNGNLVLCGRDGEPVE